MSVYKLFVLYCTYSLCVVIINSYIESEYFENTPVFVDFRFI